ncbi:family 3 encapsulin nanocompartment shell protein [Streptomyces sp. Z26]|uniref:family 3 encapsulin nanocompartment shell protein n=1 Tax=Streptomyces sp. Z26 TaxID=2500177 RepID=UPI000EF14F8F|nr:family 3 encapsulin nanocompartment shell protein [Streptomyces sp. Z26]RLL69662.1 phage major capsid protein [Streptomyces sp. Z26]
MTATDPAFGPATAGPPGATVTAHGPTQGERFAAAFQEDPEKAEVHFGFTLTDAFQAGKDRPRLTARNLFKKRHAEGDTVRGWSETRPPDSAALPESGLREDAYRFGTALHHVRPVTAWVRIPDELAGHEEALAAFVDHRLMVRLGTAENRALTYDVIDHPDVARLPYRGGAYVRGLLAAFDEIEQSGGTGHAVMVNPRDYYRELVGAGSLLGDLARERVMVCRHRQVAPGCALVGDFAMAARLLDGARSVIRVGEPPAGVCDGPGTAVSATVHESVAVQLPTHFFHVVPG